MGGGGGVFVRAFVKKEVSHFADSEGKLSSYTQRRGKRDYTEELC